MECTKDNVVAESGKAWHMLRYQHRGDAEQQPPTVLDGGGIVLTCNSGRSIFLFTIVNGKLAPTICFTSSSFFWFPVTNVTTAFRAAIVF